MACTWDMPMGRQERPASLEPKRLWKSAWQFAKSQFCEFMDFDGFSWILMDVPEFLGFGYIWIYLDSASDGKMDGVFFRSQDLNPHCWPTTKRGGPPANWVPPPPAGPTSGSWANCWNLKNLRPLGAQHSKAAPRTPLFLVHVSHWTSLNRQGVKKISAENFNKNRGSLCRKSVLWVAFLQTQSPRWYRHGSFLKSRDAAKHVGPWTIGNKLGNTMAETHPRHSRTYPPRERGTTICQCQYKGMSENGVYHQL